jgi:hypothetical protein
MADMVKTNESFDKSPTDFRLFIARIIYGTVFLIIVLLMIMGKLPYQLLAGPESWQPHTWFRPLTSILASTAVLIGFFIPSKGWSILTCALMLLFNFSYLHMGNNEQYNFIWWFIFIPLCFKAITIQTMINKNRWLIVLFAFLNWLNYGLNWGGIPVYLLYLLPFLPYIALYNSFNRYYEPR